MPLPAAWYVGERERFVREPLDIVVGHLSSGATRQGLHVEAQQHSEWRSSVGLLQTKLVERTREIEMLRESLRSPALSEYRHVVLEYDFRRRGLRMDCVLLGDGIVAVIEFKRTTITAADRDQVTSYCVNLVEFHEEMRRIIVEAGCILAPLLALTDGRATPQPPKPVAFHRAPWDAVLRHVPVCDRQGLSAALLGALEARRTRAAVDCERWIASRFAPSSTIVDAAVSLYGQHDVSAISTHAAPVELIDRCTRDVAEVAERSLREHQKRIIFVSGAPGAGKTLVGLKLAFDPRFLGQSVFVTGNSPLVKVLSAALGSAYRRRHANAGATSVLTGYSREAFRQVAAMATFKITTAHAYLGQRGTDITNAGERVVVFDEAQRTYREGRQVMRTRLEADEAILILDSLNRAFGDDTVVIALVGHNQAINTGELGISAWFKAAKSRGWRIAISDETLALSELTDIEPGALASIRDRIDHGHLPHSLRFYRNNELERWAEHVLESRPDAAVQSAALLDECGDTVWIVRDLGNARAWVRERRVGTERAGIIASGQARRLAAEGLFVDLKPDIASWMLAPGGDIRSGNMLETVQNQYQIQGLEIDYAIVCWDLDLRRQGDAWCSFKVSGATWKRDKETIALAIAKNSYRVLLTRARKGMVLFVPRGDFDGEDATRPPVLYDEIADYLAQCGAKSWKPATIDGRATR